MAREWTWGGHEATLALGTGGTSAASEIVDSEGVQTKGATIARIIGNIVVFKAVQSVGVPQFGMGIILLNDGVTDFPRPLTDYDAPWLWHQTGFIPPHDSGGDFGATRFGVDVHGMRKILGDQKLFFVGERDPAVSMSYAYGLRVGYKLA